MSTEKDNTPLWKNYPVELDGWVLAHRMLMADQNRIKVALKAFLGQVQAGHKLTPQQQTAFKAFFDHYNNSLHQHHASEETIVFPYLAKVKNLPSTKVSSDHKTLVDDLDKCCNLAASLATADASALHQLLDAFTALDKDLVEHFMEEENTLLGPMRKACTPKEVAKHITQPVADQLGWADRGQYFGKLSPEELKKMMRQEGIPFFVKWIFRANIKKYNRTFLDPLDEAVAYARRPAGSTSAVAA